MAESSKLIKQLDDLILNYVSNKRELDDYKKICDTENAQIKHIMKDLALPKHIVKDYKVVRTVQERNKIDEEILLSIFQESPELLKIAESMNIIKTKPYIDFDALENAVYKNMFSKNQLLQLDKATTTNEVVILRITKLKKNGDEE